MSNVSLRVRFPADLLTVLGKSRQEMEEEAQLSLALELFRRRWVSAGKAAELANVSLSELMDVTRERGIQWVSYTGEGLETELCGSVQLGEEAGARSGAGPGSMGAAELRSARELGGGGDSGA